MAAIPAEVGAEVLRKRRWLMLCDRVKAIKRTAVAVKCYVIWKHYTTHRREQKKQSFFCMPVQPWQTTYRDKFKCTPNLGYIVVQLDLDYYRSQHLIWAPPHWARYLCNAYSLLVIARYLNGLELTTGTPPRYGPDDYIPFHHRFLIQTTLTDNFLIPLARGAI